MVIKILSGKELLRSMLDAIGIGEQGPSLLVSDRCPYLSELESGCYCNSPERPGILITKETVKQNGPYDPLKKRQLSDAERNMFCTHDYSKCCFYKG